MTGSLSIRKDILEKEDHRRIRRNINLVNPTHVNQEGKYMAEEAQVVNEEDVLPEATSGENEQETVSEDVNTPPKEDGKDYRALYENARKALQEKNRKIQELKSEPIVEPEEVQDEGVQRFLRTEADAYIARKAVTDPSFKELLPEIEALVEQGIDIRSAEQRVKASMFEQISQQIHREPEKPPLQLTPTAVREPVQEKKDSEIDKDLLEAILRTGV